jgi:hypothetical protein
MPEKGNRELDNLMRAAKKIVPCHPRLQHPPTRAPFGT